MAWIKSLVVLTFIVVYSSALFKAGEMVADGRSDQMINEWFTSGVGILGRFDDASACVNQMTATSIHQRADLIFRRVRSGES